LLSVHRVDLHLHSCLSPCGSLDMTPMKIVQHARRCGLSMIAVTDHNSAENAPAVIRAARGSGICVLPGMEVTTAEEAHVLALFADLPAAESLQGLVYDRLLPGENDEELFGLQVVATEFDEVERMNPRLLIGATTLGVDELVREVHARDGLAIACHIDRESYSLVGQLGFIPPDLPLDGVEISRRMTLIEARARFAEYRDRPFLSASDAHEITDVGVNPTRMRLAAASFAELRRALRSEGGRGIIEEPASA
jgi:3',5'-nucleoside bisphosphate phosphatase